MELFLAKLLGLYFLIMGAIVLFRRSAVMPTVAQLSANRALVLVIAVVELAAGLALVIAQPVVSVSVSGIIALVGYILIIESIVYIAAPTRYVQKMIRKFNRPMWYVVGGLVSIAAGIYLAGTGFGLI